MQQIATIFLLMELNNRVSTQSLQESELDDLRSDTYDELRQILKKSVQETMEAVIEREKH